MEYCPWCGIKLPKPLRDEFFDILEEAGIDYPDEKERVPENMRSDKWWRDNEKYN